MAGDARRRLVLWIEYDGSEFHGWQFQPGLRTVQEEIEAALGKMCGEDIRVIASGRTDAGVHALGQVAHFNTRAKISPKKFRLGLNSILERDVAILDCREAVEKFHAQYDALRKTYRYHILTRRPPSALRRTRAWHHRRALDAERMRSGAAHLIGEHDFASFCPERVEVSTTVRRLDRLDVIEEGDEVRIEAEASGFLRFMVRNIVGTLAEVGCGERSPEEMGEILEARDRNRAGLRAPGHGLFLVRVDYGEKTPPPAEDWEGDPEEST
jgi:tRNA pseudouridine38-40 synthase